MIDIMSSDLEIGSFLDNTIHSRSEVAEDNDQTAEDPNTPEQCYPFICRKDAAFEPMKVLVKNFAQLIKAKAVRSGDLLVFSCQDSLDAVYFLGTMLKNPHLQMLVTASLSDSEAEFTLVDGCPEILTSHEVFLKYIRGCRDPSSLKLEILVWRGQCFLDRGNHLKLNPSTQVCELHLSTTPLPAEKKPKVDLPLGLKLPKRPRKAVNKKRQSAKRTHPDSFAEAEAMNLGSASDKECEGGQDSESDNENDIIDINKESETMVAPSDTVAAEEAEIKKVAREIEQADILRADVAEAISLNQLTQSAFFAKSLGLDETGSLAGLAATGRARCLHCKNLIIKGGPRFAWYYSRARPHGWLHAHCTVHHILGQKDASFVESSLKRLKDLCNTKQAQSASSARSKPEDTEILAWSQKVISVLEKQ